MNSDSVKILQASLQEVQLKIFLLLAYSLIISIIISIYPLVIRENNF